MAKDHTDSEIGNTLPPHGLLFPISRQDNTCHDLSYTVVVQVAVQVEVAGLQVAAQVLVIVVQLAVQVVVAVVQ